MSAPKVTQPLCGPKNFLAERPLNEPGPPRPLPPFPSLVDIGFDFGYRVDPVHFQDLFFPFDVLAFSSITKGMHACQMPEKLEIQADDVWRPGVPPGPNGPTHFAFEPVD